jgi:hypothetical protein
VAIHDNPAVVVFLEPVDAPDQGRFAGPGRAANDDPFALFHRQTDIFQGLKLAKKFIDFLQ